MDKKEKNRQCQEGGRIEKIKVQIMGEKRVQLERRIPTLKERYEPES